MAKQVTTTYVSDIGGKGVRDSDLLHISIREHQNRSGRGEPRVWKLDLSRAEVATMFEAHSTNYEESGRETQAPGRKATDDSSDEN